MVRLFCGKSVMSPICVQFCVMRYSWQVSHINYGTFPDVGKSKFVLII